MKNWYSNPANKGRTQADMIGDYNRIIDSMYDYKHEMGKEPYIGAGSYRHDTKVGEFNRNNRAIYSSANSAGGVHGYSEGQENWNGTTTAQRFIDRTDQDIDQFNWKFGEGDTDEYKALYNNLVKGSDGRYYIQEPDGTVEDVTEQVAENGTTTNPLAGGAQQSGEGKITYNAVGNSQTAQANKPRYNPQYMNALPGFFNAERFMASLIHNRKQLELARKLPTVLYEPMEANRWVRGDLGAIQQGHQAAGIINHMMTSTPTSADAAQQAAAQLEANEKGQEYINKGYAANDTEAQRTAELNWNQARQNQQSRYQTAMKNRENLFEHRTNWMTALANYKRANYESINNLLSGFEQKAEAQLQENKAYGEAVQKASLQNEISAHMLDNGLNVTADDQALMDDYLSGDRQLSDMTEDEQNRIGQLTRQIEELVLQKQAANRGFKYTPYSRTTTPTSSNGYSQEISLTGWHKQGGKLGGKSEKVAIQELRSKIQKMQVFQKHLESRMNAFEKDLDRAQRGAGQYIQGQKWSK